MLTVHCDPRAAENKDLERYGTVFRLWMETIGRSWPRDHSLQLYWHRAIIIS
jgi:hypothetical protein